MRLTFKQAFRTSRGVSFSDFFILPEKKKESVTYDLKQTVSSREGNYSVLEQCFTLMATDLCSVSREDVILTASYQTLVAVFTAFRYTNFNPKATASTGNFPLSQ